MAFRASFGQGVGVPEHAADLADGIAGGFGIFHVRQLFQVLRLVTHPAGICADLLGFDPVPVALFARGVPCGGKAACGHLPMAIRTGDPVLGDVEIVAERELEIVFLVASRQQDRQQDQRCVAK